MLGPFSQSLYSTVLDAKSNNLLPFLIRRASFKIRCYINRIITTVLVTKTGISYTVVVQYTFFEFQLHCIEFNVPRTNISINSATGKKSQDL